MNVLREAIEHATLGWIKPELDAALDMVAREGRGVVPRHRQQPTGRRPFQISHF